MINPKELKVGDILMYQFTDHPDKYLIEVTNVCYKETPLYKVYGTMMFRLPYIYQTSINGGDLQHLTNLDEALYE